MKTLKKNLTTFYHTLTPMLVGLSFFIASLLTPPSASAQSYCASSLELDTFGCRDISLPRDPAICDWYTTGGKSTYSCTADDSNCWTLGPACSSNDSTAACKTIYQDFGDGPVATSCQTNLGACSKAQCWANGNSPPPTPATCDPYWGCLNQNPYNASTLADCQASGATDCDCSYKSCNNNPPTGRRAIIVFEDTNWNGVWDYAAGEKRISPSSSCTSGNTKYVAGVEIMVDGQTRGQDCNVGNNEDIGGQACTGNYTCPNGAQSTCSTWTSTAIVNKIGGTCFKEKSCTDYPPNACNSGGYCKTSVMIKN